MFRLYSVVIFTTLVLICVETRIYRYHVDKSCGRNQTYNSCGNRCSPYCNQQLDEIKECDSLCHPVCYCKQGFVREAVDSAKCIVEEDCYRLPKCGKNEIYKDCKSLCPIYCDHLDVKRCDERCIKGCACKNGLIRLTKSEKSDCISPSDCPA